MTFPRINELVARLGPTLTSFIIGVLFATWAVLGDYSGIEGTTVNARFKLRNLFFPWDKPPDDIVFIDINDEALTSYLHNMTRNPKRWPWPRSTWAEIHYLMHELRIRPEAMVYDIVFDLADDSQVEYAGTRLASTIDLDELPTNDALFQAQLSDASEIATFLAAILRPQSPVQFFRQDYEKPYSADGPIRWVPPPPEFTRFGIPYDREVHGPVYHAKEVSIPWDSKWWSKVAKMTEDEYADLEFLGMTSSLLEGIAGSGMTTMDPEEDGITRWAPLFSEYDGILYPCLPLQVVLHKLGVELEDVTFEPGFVVIPRDDETPIRIPVDERKRLLLNFRFERPDYRKGIQQEGGYEYVNFWKVYYGLFDLKGGIEPDYDPRSLDGKIVLIGSSAEGTFDLRAIPISQRFPAVGILGTMIRSILQEDFLRYVPTWLNFLWIIFGSVLVGILGQFFAPIKHAAATLVLAGVHALTCFFLFARFGYVMDYFHVAFAEIVSYAVVTISQYLQVSTLFGRYVTPEVRQYLMSNNSALELGGEEVEVSILFSDLKGFTSMSEKLEPGEVISALNDYFGPMFEIVIDDNKGTLDKLIGDAIMAYFGHPRPDSNHPLEAVTAALSMQKKLAILRDQWEKEGKPTIRMRIGVNTGPVVAGNMGSAGRTDYSIIGDNVNLAARLESNAPVDGVLISETTYLRVKDRFVFKEREPILVKGKEKPVKVYEVLDFK